MRGNIDIPEAVELYEAGATIRSLAERYNVSRVRMRDNLFHGGATIRGRGPNKVYKECDKIQPSDPTRLARTLDWPCDPLETRERLVEMTYNEFAHEWVTMVIDMLVAGGSCSISQMAGILVTVRERYRDADAISEQGRQGRTQAHAAA